MGDCDDWNEEDLSDVGFLRLTVGQPLAQRQAAEVLYNLLNMAFTIRYDERGALENSDSETMKNLPRRIRFFAGVLNDSPVESYDIAEICGLSRKIAQTIRRLDQSWDDEFRQKFGPRVKQSIMDVLETIEKFDETPRD